jgi:hypothetical protein
VVLLSGYEAELRRIERGIADLSVDDRFAGPRLTVIPRGGSPSPSEASAARTGSRDSAAALSGNPTTVKAGNPEAIVTWVSTSMTSTP